MLLFCLCFAAEPQFVFLSLVCGRAAKFDFCAAKPHVQKQLRHSRNKKKEINKLIEKTEITRQNSMHKL